jgi:hypothetical protein
MITGNGNFPVLWDLVNNKKLFILNFEENLKEKQKSRYNNSRND